MGIFLLATSLGSMKAIAQTPSPPPLMTKPSNTPSANTSSSGTTASSPGLGVDENDPVIARYRERLKVLEEEIKLLNAQKDILDQQQQRAATERTTFENLLPNVTNASQPLEGKFTGLGNLQAESRFMILDGVTKMGNTIKKRIPPGTTVIVYDNELLEFMSQFRLITAQLDLLTAKYKDFLPDTKSSSRDFASVDFPLTQALRSFEGLTRITRSVIDFLALFRTKREFQEIEGKGFLDEKVLASTIAGAISADKSTRITVYYPNIYSPVPDLIQQFNIQQPQSFQTNNLRDFTFSQNDASNKSPILTVENFIERKQNLQQLLMRGIEQQRTMENSDNDDQTKETANALKELNIVKNFLKSFVVATIMRIILKFLMGISAANGFNRLKPFKFIFYLC
jgi:hypothetical protein